MGPSTWRESHNHSAGYGGTGPTDGRSPTTPQNEAGMRREPPRSVPSARAIIPVTRPAAPPPVEPPAVRGGAHGTPPARRSEEPTSEHQSLAYLLCRLLLGEKKKSERYGL